LTALSNKMVAPPEARRRLRRAQTVALTPEENPDIAAGFTYLGQFLDHDLTKETRPHGPNDLSTPVDVSADLVNARTPQLDLDSLYGSGPTLSPQLYAADGMHLAVGSSMTGSSDAGAVDLPRDSATDVALIGDPRNDENRIVAGLHSLFIRFHNKIVDRIRAASPGLAAAQVLARAQADVRQHWQWLVLTDYLPTVVNPSVVHSVVRRTDGKWVTSLRHWTPCAGMPIEFSFAAYRFGHSMVRDVYALNAAVTAIPIFSDSPSPRDSLGGFSRPPLDYAIEWSNFVDGVAAPSLLPPPPPAQRESPPPADAQKRGPLALLPSLTTERAPKTRAKMPGTPDLRRASTLGRSATLAELQAQMPASAVEAAKVLPGGDAKQLLREDDSLLRAIFSSVLR